MVHRRVGLCAWPGRLPGRYATGLPIKGLRIDSDVVVPGRHAPARGPDAGDGGRARAERDGDGAALEAARQKAYANVGRIHFEGAHYRRDIGLEPEG
jgi:phosphoribosylamine--glycine ligase